jgi:hypothetical protein
MNIETEVIRERNKRIKTNARKEKGILGDRPTQRRKDEFSFPFLFTFL